MQSDRFAREIVCILALSYAVRSRRLNGNPFGSYDSRHSQMNGRIAMVL